MADICLAQAIYYEARGESELGQRAVGHVVMNRVKSPRFPNSTCKVISQKHQFSWYGKGLRAPRGPAWSKALRVASNLGGDPTRGAVNFHATYVNPGWRNLIRTVKIGTHIFYRMRG